MGLTRRVLFFATAAGLAGASTWLAYRGVDRPVVGIDDANIFLAYAQNIAAGEGFVYYPRGERVEGFTSLLWVLACALATVTSGHRELLLLGTNVGLVALSVAGAGLFVWRELSARGEGAGRALVGAAAVFVWAFLSPSYMGWSTVSLMDTALWGCVFTLGSLAAAGSVGAGRAPTLGLSACVAVALLTRPESMLIAAVWVGSAAVATFALTGDVRGSLRRYLVPASAYLLTLGALVAFRMAYFHYPLPNTYYAKVSPSATYNLYVGAKYFGGFVLSQTFVIFCLGAALASVVRFLRNFHPRLTMPGPPSARVFVLSCSVLTGVVVPVLAGGDHFGLYRFYQPLWPLLIVPLVLAAAVKFPGAGARDPSPVSSPGGAYVLLAAAVICVYFCERPRWDEFLRYKADVRNFAYEIDLAIEGRTIGRELSRFLKVDPSLSVGVVTAGGVAVTFKGTTIDLMGLNHVKMGHSAGDRRGMKNHAAFNVDVFYELRPDLVYPRIVDNADFSVDDLRREKHINPIFLKGVQATPRFRSEYALTRTPLEGENWSLIVWARNDVVTRLKKGGIALEVIPYQEETGVTLR